MKSVRQFRRENLLHVKKNVYNGWVFPFLLQKIAFFFLKITLSGNKHSTKIFTKVFCLLYIVSKRFQTMGAICITAAARDFNFFIKHVEECP